jgi:hypothetical protein
MCGQVPAPVWTRGSVKGQWKQISIGGEMERERGRRRVELGRREEAEEGVRGGKRG